MVAYESAVGEHLLQSLQSDDNTISLGVRSTTECAPAFWKPPRYAVRDGGGGGLGRGRLLNASHSRIGSKPTVYCLSPYDTGQEGSLVLQLLLGIGMDSYVSTTASVGR